MIYYAVLVPIAVVAILAGRLDAVIAGFAVFGLLIVIRDAARRFVDWADRESWKRARISRKPLSIEERVGDVGTCDVCRDEEVPVTTQDGVSKCNGCLCPAPAPTPPNARVFGLWLYCPRCHCETYSVPGTRTCRHCGERRP